MNSYKHWRIKIIAWVNGLAAVLHFLFWIFTLIKLPPLASETQLMVKVNLATTFGFGIADLIWSVPLLLIASIPLYKKQIMGWLAAHMANVLYWYSFTVIITRDIASNSISPGTILFLPFALFSIWAAYYLWKGRSEFLGKR